MVVYEKNDTDVLGKIITSLTEEIGSPTANDTIKRFKTEQEFNYYESIINNLTNLKNLINP